MKALLSTALQQLSFKPFAFNLQIGQESICHARTFEDDGVATSQFDRDRDHLRVLSLSVWDRGLAHHSAHPLPSGALVVVAEYHSCSLEELTSLDRIQIVLQDSFAGRFSHDAEDTESIAKAAGRAA